MDREPYTTRWRSKAGSRSVAAAVNYVLSEYSLREPHINFTSAISVNAMQQNGIQQRMKSEKVVLSEINSDLWDRAMITLLSEINTNFYPHILAIQELVNHTLNSEIIDIAMVTHVFSKLIIFHPPSMANNYKYYWSILNDKYVCLDTVKEEENDLFWLLIDTTMSCLENESCLKGFQSYYSNENSNENSDITKNLNENLNKLTNLCDEDCSIICKPKMCFYSLPVSVQFQRVLIVLKFVLDIFEYEYKQKITQGSFKESKKSRLFLSKLLWPNINDSGVVNGKVKKLISFLKLMENVEFSHTQCIQRVDFGEIPQCFVKFITCWASSVYSRWTVMKVMTKLISLTAEIIRLRDAPACAQYPFLGDYSTDFAHEMSFTLVPNVKDEYCGETLALVRELKPDWLRMHVCSSLLTRVTGKLCNCDLTVAQEVMEMAFDLKNKRRRRRKKRQTSEIPAYTRLETSECHAACRLSLSNHTKRRKLLKGLAAGITGEWSPLHKAVLIGHVECVEELLGDPNKHFDARLPGLGGYTPLMCAVAQDHTDVCRTLLEHAGRVLLEDVNAEGLTAADLARNDRMTLLLESFHVRGANGLSTLSSKDVDLAMDACLMLIDSYFKTYRTLDVCRWQGRQDDAVGDERDIRWDYARYEADIGSNLSKLSDIICKTAEISDSKSSVHALKWILDRRHCV